MHQKGWVGRARTAARIDLAPGRHQPPVRMVVVATVVSIVASLGVDVLLVRLAVSLFPATKGYAHFRFSDYGALTATGIVPAGVAWPAVARLTVAPRWLFLRLAVVVSVVLLAPDVWLLGQGEPRDAVAVLVAMHLAIALITYNLLVHLAPAGPADPSGVVAAPAGRRGPITPPMPAGARGVWVVMASLVGLETALGVVALVVVPTDRPDAWVPAGGRDVYLAHAVVGAVLGIGAASLLVTRLRADRLSLNCALVGLISTALGAGGGLLAVYQPDRILGMGLMLVAAFVAGFAYLTPVGAAGDSRVAPGAARDEWDDRRGRELACPRCRAAAIEVRRRMAPDMGPEEWAAARIAAGTCPLCPDRSLRPDGGISICECCETVYRSLPDDGDGAAWIATPGQRVTRR